MSKFGSTPSYGPEKINYCNATRCTIIALYYASDPSVFFKPTLVYFLNVIVLHMLALSVALIFAVVADN